MKARILVVEDNASNVELLCDWLELKGYEVIAASDIAQARAVISSGRCDAVLLDIRLGEEDGANLAAWIRRNPSYRDMPVIAVTAHALPAEQKRIIQSGCNACVSKPIDFHRFSEILNRWLEDGTDSPIPSRQVRKANTPKPSTSHKA